MTNPFKKLTILSLEQATVLPYLTYRLAMDGCRVIRLEHPVYGDPNRMVGENFLGEERMNQYYMAINSGKEALTLNLGDPDGVALLDELLVKLNVDIFATNQLPRNYDKLSISYERLSAVKPDLIWLGVTGFGPESNEAAYDPILQARGGLMELTGEAGADPQVVGIPLPDMGTSEHAYGLLMKALYERSVTGRGPPHRHVHVHEHHQLADRARDPDRHLWPTCQPPRQHPRILCPGFRVPHQRRICLHSRGQ